jgi:hypothetical protein
MFRQFSAAESHRCHWRENDVGVGLHVPFDTASSSPTCADPETAGLTELVGPFFESTTSVGSDVAVPLPSAFVAVTSTRMVRETSAVASVYVSFVAPLMSPHAVPSVAQRLHWYANDVGLLLHVPFLAVSVPPSFAVPPIVGGLVLAGAASERARATAPAAPHATTIVASTTTSRRPIRCRFITRAPLRFTAFVACLPQRNRVQA